MARSAQILPGRLLILILALSAIFLLFSSRVGADQPQVLSEHVVERGDTLWAIASEVAEPDDNVRYVVSRLRELNGLETSRLSPGQKLLVPSG